MTDDLVSAEEARRLRDIYDGRIEFISQAWRIAELEARLRDLVDEYERLIDRCPPEVPVLHLPLIRASLALRGPSDA